MAVDGLDGDVGTIHGTVESATEHTATESAAGSLYVGAAFYLSRIATAHNVHIRIAIVEMFVFLAQLKVDAEVNFLVPHHINVDVGISINNSILTESATEDTEVWRSHLIIYLLPFGGLVEVQVLGLSRFHLRILMQESIGNGDIGVVAHFAGLVATTVDIVVYLELQGLVVVLWRIGDTIDDTGWIPGTGIWVPVRRKQGFATHDNHVGIAGYICRSDLFSIAGSLFSIHCLGITISPSAAIDAMTYITIPDADEGIAIYRSVLASAVDAFVEGRDDIGIDSFSRMLHGFCAPRFESLLGSFIVIWIRDDWSVDDQTGIAIDATQILIAATFRCEATFTAGKYLREDGATTDVDQRGAVLRNLVLLIGKYIWTCLCITHVGNIATAIYATPYHGTVYRSQVFSVCRIIKVSTVDMNLRLWNAGHIWEVNPCILFIVRIRNRFYAGTTAIYILSDKTRLDEYSG